MNISYNHWKKLFLFCLGLALATTLCMKWMEPDFWVNGERFTIMGLELFYSKERLVPVLTGLDSQVKTILGYHLHFDFVLMAGIYPGITSLCMMAREKVVKRTIKKALFVFASLQVLAWAADIRENIYLLDWIKRPEIGDEFATYHFIVATKWIIALLAAVVSVVVLLLNRSKK